MILMTTKGTFSLIEKNGGYEVRARSRDHLLNFFAVWEIHVTPDRDYPFRATLEKEHLPLFMNDVSQTVNYSNFKEAVAETGDDLQYKLVYETWNAFKRLFD